MKYSHAHRCLEAPILFAFLHYSSIFFDGFLIKTKQNTYIFLTLNFN